VFCGLGICKRSCAVLTRQNAPGNGSESEIVRHHNGLNTTLNVCGMHDPTLGLLDLSDKLEEILTSIGRGDSGVLFTFQS
jgi:hypothetical protein